MCVCVDVFRGVMVHLRLEASGERLWPNFLAAWSCEQHFPPCGSLEKGKAFADENNMEGRLSTERRMVVSVPPPQKKKRFRVAYRISR